MPVIIPFSDTSNFSEEVSLNGVPYRFAIMWNVREEYWTLSVLTRNLTKLISGIKLVLGYQLFDQYPGKSLPPGEMYAIDMTEDQEKITRENMLEEVKLIYIPEDEVDTV